MQVTRSTPFAATPRNLIGLSTFFLAVAAVFGFLNASKTSSLQQELLTATATRENFERQRAAQAKANKAREAKVAASTAKVNDNEGKIAQAESQLVQMQKERNDLQNKLQAAQADVSSLQAQLEATAGKPPDNPGAPSTTELQAQLDEARRQLENAEHENAFLSEKIRTAQDRPVPAEEEKRHRPAVAAKVGVRGTVLAVNQAYNFVVLNLGGRNGVETNAEMLVLRDGTLIGKIRVSSVEPSTAIGDIVTSSLARGVQVQPGDTVVYAGTNS